LLRCGADLQDTIRALAFYVDVLGFEKRLDMPMEQLGSRWIEVAPAGSAVTVALVQAGEGNEAGGEVGIRFLTADAAALHARLTAAGVGVGELLNWPGVPPMFTFRDQDGNGLEIVEDYSG
jgi:catechol 2,3-dioxygenase-like lactoylglutathione lyase family enzyme